MANSKHFFLYPFSLIYGLITDIRNILYDKGLLHSEEFETPVICVGNITVGGTGKTPHTEYLINLLHHHFKVAVLSRGYRRKSKGFLYAGANSTYRDIGDEPLQISRKFPGILVAVDADRIHGVINILKGHPGTDVIILDDGFQHRRIKPGLSILLTDYNRLMVRDQMMPYGNLRESKRNISRADLVIVTKSPEDITGEMMDSIQEEIRYVSDKKCFFTKISYKEPVALFSQNSAPLLQLSAVHPGERGAVIITGIANPAPFRRHLEKYFGEIKHLNFPDHHGFTDNDIKDVSDAWDDIKSTEKYLITTEKDAVRLKEFANIADSMKRAFYYIPVGVVFVNTQKEEFDNMIIEYVRKNK